MSYYYEYYLGYEEDGKIFPLGPYNNEGKIIPIVCRPKSVASDLHEHFAIVPDGKASDELKKHFEYTGFYDEPALNARYLPASEMPNEDFIKDGYFLIKDVSTYISSDMDAEDAHFLLGNPISPKIYSAMLINEIALGQPNKEVPNDGIVDYDDEPHSATEYMYFAYPDYYCKEYESHLILSLLREFDAADGIKRSYVILESEG